LVVGSLLDVVVGFFGVYGGPGVQFYFFYYLPNLQNLFVFLSVMLFAAVIRFSRIWYETEMTTRKLAAEKQATELAFLKAQVNPHFLFNTLNSLYALAVEKNQGRIGAKHRFAGRLNALSDLRNQC
jgi:hypothetical protein